MLPLLQVLELREGRQDKEDQAADVSKLVEGLKKERDVLVKKHKVMEQGLKVSARVFCGYLALNGPLSAVVMTVVNVLCCWLEVSTVSGMLEGILGLMGAFEHRAMDHGIKVNARAL